MVSTGRFVQERRVTVHGLTEAARLVVLLARASARQ